MLVSIIILAGGFACLIIQQYFDMQRDKKKVRN